MTTRLEQKEKRKSEILDAALDQFIRRGYAGTKIKDIANAAGMSMGLLFHYFSSKEELYTELVRLGAQAPKGMIERITTRSAIEFFEQCARMTLEFAASSPFTAKMFVLMNSAYYTEGIPMEAQALAVSTNFYRELVPLIVQGQQEGSIREGEPLALCMAFWTALQGAVGAFALDSSLPLPKAEWVVDIIAAKGER